MLPSLCVALALVAGTCIGEIPPYWMARAARLAAAGGEELKGDIPEELEVTSQYWVVNRVKGQFLVVQCITVQCSSAVRFLYKRLAY
mgnify:CR=1 FL=1